MPLSEGGTDLTMTQLDRCVRTASNTLSLAGTGLRSVQPTKGDTIMYEYIKTWASLKTDRRAVTALEYGLIAGIIVAVITLGFGVLGTNLSNKFSTIGASL